MSTVDPARGRDFGDLVRALIEEAWRRARRRRLMYGGILFSLAVIGAVIAATLQGPSTSNSISPAVLAGPSTRVSGIIASVHVYHGVFRLRGEHGGLSVAVAFPARGARSWDVIGSDFGDFRFGQYDELAGGHGKHVEAGGHASAWYARLVGVVIPKDRGPRQRIVIKLKGRPKGTFTLVPLQPGGLKRDSGTQSSGWLG